MESSLPQIGRKSHHGGAETRKKPRLVKDKNASTAEGKLENRRHGLRLALLFRVVICPNGRLPMFDPAAYGYSFKNKFDKRTLGRLLNQFEDEVKREGDKKLAAELRAQVLNSDTPSMTRETFNRLARWCKTDGIYGDGMQIAQKISEILFGRIIDRASIGT